MNDRQRPNRQSLLDLATGQQGYFTASQARACGYSAPLLSHHASSGGFAKIRRGVYRFSDIPPFKREAELTAWLAAGRDTSVLSHETALELLGLGDVIPDRIHLTIPRSRRGYRGGKGVKIHTSSRPLRTEDRTTWRGMNLTSVARSIVDAVESGTHPDQAAAAIRTALDRGLTTTDRLLEQIETKNRRVKRLVRDALE